jgi:Tfp pilus assembly protein PilN
VSQQLNLVNPALLPPKPFFQFRSMMLALGVLAGVLVLFSFVIFWGVGTYEAEAASMAQREATKKTQVAELEQKTGSRQVSPQVLEEQSAALAEQQRLEELSGQIAQVGGGKSLRSRADILFALAHQPAEGLWLTGVDVTGDHIALQGQTLSAAYLPKWLAQLQQLPAFAGQRFGGLEIGLGTASADSASAPVTTTLTFHLTAVSTGKTP